MKVVRLYKSSNLPHYSDIVKTPQILVMITVAVRVGMTMGSSTRRSFALSTDCASCYRMDQHVPHPDLRRGSI
jgi:hypothetical protein